MAGVLLLCKYWENSNYYISVCDASGRVQPVTTKTISMSSSQFANVILAIM